MINTEKYLSRNDVAKRLNVSVMTVGRWLQSGKLPGYKFGNIVRILESDLDKFIAENHIKSDRFSEDKTKKLLELSGKWVGPKEEYKKILKEIEESQKNAEF